MAQVILPQKKSSSLGQIGQIGGAIAGGIATGGSPQGIAAGAGMGGTAGGMLEGNPKQIAPVQTNQSAMSRRMESVAPQTSELNDAHNALAYLPPEQQRKYGPAIQRAKQLQDQEIA